MMFSHIDQNMAGLEFPEHNFVFTEQFTELLKTYRTGADERFEGSLVTVTVTADRRRTTGGRQMTSG